MDKLDIIQRSVLSHKDEQEDLITELKEKIHTFETQIIKEHDKSKKVKSNVQDETTFSLNIIPDKPKDINNNDQSTNSSQIHPDDTKPDIDIGNLILAESKAKLELDKIQTRRELETAEVKLEILEGVSQGGSVLDDAKKYLPQADICANFLKTVSASHDQNKNSSVPNILSSSVPFTSDTNVDYAINQNQPVVAPFVSSSGLNPEVNEFVPIQRETSSFRAMDHVQTDSVHVDLPKTEMPIMSKTISSDVVTDLAKSFADQVNLNRLPPPEPPIFNGDPLKYASWKVAFETLIE
ncbi:Hypothetical predicted protein [Mytilus galloprovincialis]|uniref:Uncharacterized protein n=1 Tax=Mytilus galloprovincialis TaxID=29158 RepID=A0A8B6CTJ2_MYTGA|nr:Hypothetical predicted protein [Mytilus galloprovincialis]